MSIQDPEVQRLAAIAARLENEYKDRNRLWNDSQFAWIKGGLPAGSRGAVFQRLVSEWCVSKGVSVTRSPDSDADRIIGGRRAEIKGSTLWEDGTYTFQQIRDQNYELVVCLGISPFDAHCWVIPKDDIMALRDEGLISPQHGGSRGSDTLWINGVNPKNPPDWIRPYGGTLSAGFAQLQSLTR